MGGLSLTPRTLRCKTDASAAVRQHRVDRCLPNDGRTGWDRMDRNRWLPCHATTATNDLEWQRTRDGLRLDRNRDLDRLDPQAANDRPSGFARVRKTGLTRHNVPVLVRVV
jgi:hypothetical protein